MGALLGPGSTSRSIGMHSLSISLSRRARPPALPCGSSTPCRRPRHPWTAWPATPAQPPRVSAVSLRKVIPYWYTSRLHVRADGGWGGWWLGVGQELNLQQLNQRRWSSSSSAYEPLLAA